MSDSRRASWSSPVGTANASRRSCGRVARGSDMPSFDVVSEVNAHELTNAVDQANRELTQRFDFKDTGAAYELQDYTVTLRAQVDFQLRQMLEILKLRLTKRGIDLACLQIKDPQITLATAQQQVILRQGIDADC